MNRYLVIWRPEIMPNDPYRDTVVEATSRSEAITAVANDYPAPIIVNRVRELVALEVSGRIGHELGAVTDTTLEQMIDDRDVELDSLRTIVFGLVSDALSGLVEETDLRATSHPGRSTLELTTARGSMLELELGVVFRRKVSSWDGCSCTYAAFPRHGGGTVTDISTVDPDCPVHGDELDECEGHESTDGPIGNVVYCDGSCRTTLDTTTGRITR